MTETAKNLQCMEVWGGFQPVNSGVIMPGLDAWVFSQPAGGASDGGDVHYVSSCAAGEIARMLLADVAGHGAGVSAIAGRLRTLMRRYIISHDQTQLVVSLNRDFAGQTEDGRFATAVIMTFRATKNHLQVSNAGHPPPLWYRSRQRRWTFLDVNEQNGGIPLGIEETEYRQFEADLAVGDIILCYTDALSEARDDLGELLGSDGLMRLAQALDVTDPSTIVPQLLAAVEKLHPGNLSADDLTVLMFRPNGLRRRIPLRDRLLSPLRFFKARLRG